jgi:hypothetical protein
MYIMPWIKKAIKRQKGLGPDHITFRPVSGIAYIFGYIALHTLEFGGNLPSLSIYWISGLLRKPLSCGNEAGVYSVSAISARTGRMRCMSYRTWRRLVCQVKTVWSLSGLSGTSQCISPPYTHTYQQFKACQGNMWTVPLGKHFLRRHATQVRSLSIR